MTGQPRTVFISYRREDSQGAAGRISDFLRRETTLRVLIDVESIAVGLDYTKVIREQVAASDAVLVVIGPGWLTSTGPEGNLRLKDRDDAVRLEVATALKEDKAVVPVLVDGASMPKKADLPQNLAALAVRNGTFLRHESFSRDLTAIVESLSSILFPPTQPSEPIAPIALTTPLKARGEGLLKKFTEETSPALKAKALDKRAALVKRMEEDPFKDTRVWNKNPAAKKFLGKVRDKTDPTLRNQDAVPEFTDEAALVAYASTLSDEDFLSLAGKLRTSGWSDEAIQAQLQPVRPDLPLD